MPAFATRVGVSGMGLTSSLGAGVDEAWQRLLAGEGSIGPLSFGDLPEVAAAAVSSDLGAGLTKLQMVGTERVSQMALGAVRKAMADAALEAWPDPERVGLYVGTGMGGASTMDTAFNALYTGHRIPPLSIPAGMVNGAAGVVAMHTNIQGPVLTYGVACASSAVAIAEAAHALRRGEIDIAIAGGVEAGLTHAYIGAWQALRTLAPPDGEDVTRSCRPFSPDRRGLVLGEGAAFLVLRREEDIESEGRAPHAWLTGSAVRCDALHLTNPQVRGQVAAMQAALRSAGLSPADIGYCNAHGTGTLAGDPVECEALRQVWAESAPSLAVSSTKAAHGHLLGAAGALEAVWTVLALRTETLPPTRGVTEIDPACQGLSHVLGEGQSRPGLRHALSNSFAFGGTNASLVFSRAG